MKLIALEADRLEAGGKVVGASVPILNVILIDDFHKALEYQSESQESAICGYYINRQVGVEPAVRFSSQFDLEQKVTKEAKEKGETLPFFEQLPKQRLELAVVETSSFPSFASVLNSILNRR